MSAARQLVLVRHAEPVVDFNQPSGRWPLSPSGVEAAAALAAALVVPNPPALLLVSPELKAVQTAEPLARAFGLPVTIAADLREHEAPGYLPADEFQKAVRALFAHPSEAVFGESANAAAERFARAVDRSDASHIVVVSHGRVLSAYLARITGACGWRIWRDLTMPDALCVDFDTPGAAVVARMGSQRALKWNPSSGAA
jgi:2,3-bisphosphoglycerate-dependent phosphoglycerate mutase